MSPATYGKELFEHLEVLERSVAGTNAEASFDFLLDALLRAGTGPDERRASIVSTVARWQAVYRPVLPSAVDED